MSRCFLLNWGEQDVEHAYFGFFFFPFAVDFCLDSNGLVCFMNTALFIQTNKYIWYLLCSGSFLSPESSAVTKWDSSFYWVLCWRFIEELYWNRPRSTLGRRADTKIGWNTFIMHWQRHLWRELMFHMGNWLNKNMRSLGINCLTCISCMR